MKDIKAKILGAAALLPLAAFGISRPVLAEVVKVKIAEMGFVPAQVHIKPGDTIDWSNTDFVDHTATATDKSWDVLIKAGQTARYTFNQPGTTNYFCRFHPDMAGTIVVGP
jgi:plastocyanin